MPQDAKKLQGDDAYIRIDIGEYRIIYRHDKEKDLITVVLIRRRNDDNIYRVAKRVVE